MHSEKCSTIHYVNIWNNKLSVFLLEYLVLYQSNGSTLNVIVLIQNEMSLRVSTFPVLVMSLQISIICFKIISRVLKIHQLQCIKLLKINTLQRITMTKLWQCISKTAILYSTYHNNYHGFSWPRLRTSNQFLVHLYCDKTYPLITNGLMTVTNIVCSTILLLPLSNQHDNYWLSVAYLTPRHLQPSWWREWVQWRIFLLINFWHIIDLSKLCDMFDNTHWAP